MTNLVTRYNLTIVDTDDQNDPKAGPELIFRSDLESCAAYAYPSAVPASEGAWVRYEDYARLMHDIEAGSAQIQKLALKCAALADLHYGDPNAEPPLMDASARVVEPSATMAHLEPVQLRRIIDRHVRWHDKAMALLKEAANLERKPADLARLIEFIDQSETRLVTR